MPTLYSLINQTPRYRTVNLAPVTDKAIHLPPSGRDNVLEEELKAVEVVGGIKAGSLAAIPLMTTPARPPKTPSPSLAEEATTKARTADTTTTRRRGRRS